MSDQHNSLMNDLLISIINLIELICKEAARKVKKTHVYFKEISDNLNENDREKFLFNCFSIPNDKVKLALVNCILQVPLRELDIEEINYLMKVISESKNIGAGKAEEIISTIFRIFINLVVDIENPASSSFRIKYGKMAISHCLEILLKNQKRKIEDEDEAEEKMMLSVSCLYFLKEASRSPQMHKSLKEDDFKEYFTENLLAEQNFTFKNHQNIPIEIEYTDLGSSFLSLRDSLAGPKALNPFTIVSFRVIQQIANVLQNYDTNQFNRKKGANEKKIEKMKYNLFKGLQMRIKSELDLWKESDEEKYHLVLSMDQEVKKKMIEEHQKFAENSGLYMLVLFLTKKKAKRYATIKEEETEKNPLLSQDISNNYTKEGFDKDYKDWLEYKNADRVKRIELFDTSKLFGSKKSVDHAADNVTKLRKALKNQKIVNSSFYDQEKIADPSLYLGELTIEHIKEPSQVKDDDEDNISTDKQVSADDLQISTIAALLRIIYSSIVYSPVDEYRNKIILQLYDIHILRKITVLCNKCKWTAGNVGVKYLTIIRNAIEMDAFTESEDKSKASKPTTQRNSKILNRLQFYEILAKSIREILCEVNINFSTKRSKNIKEYKKELNILAEIALCCRLMIERCSKYMQGSTKELADEMTSEFYHEEYKSNLAWEKPIDKDTYKVFKIHTTTKEQRVLDIRTPQQRQLDWIISSLVTKETVTTLIKYCMFQFEDNGEGGSDDDSDEDRQTSDNNQQSELDDSEESDDEEEKIGTTYGGPTKTRGATKTHKTLTDKKSAAVSGDEVLMKNAKIPIEIRERDRFKENLKQMLGEYLSK